MRLTRITIILLVQVSCLLPVLAQQGRVIEPWKRQEAQVPGYFEQVVAPGAIWCTVSECTNLLIVGHEPGMDRHLTIFNLDIAGHVVTTVPPATVVLPLDPALAQYDNVALAGVCHPDFPLLYVFQDFPNSQFPHFPGHVMPDITSPESSHVMQKFDRLFVYRLENGSAEKLASVRGDWIAYGSYGRGGDYAKLARLGLDAANGRLYMPLLINPDERKRNLSAHGYLALDGRGLPVVKDGRVSLAESFNLTGGGVTGLGWAFLPLDRVACGSGHGPLLIWHRPDGQAQNLSLSPSHAFDIAGHPTMPIVYGIYCNHTLSVIEFVEGHPTLQPRFLRSGNLYSPPVPMGGRNLLAVGRHDNVTVFDLDAEGLLTGASTPIRLKGTKFRAVHYSPHFDRLYMAATLEP